MPLPNIQQSETETLEEAKTRIETIVSSAIGQQDVVEIEVHYTLSEQLRTWVESEGMRCGRLILPNHVHVLVINMTLPPLPPSPPPTFEQIQAEINLAASTAQHAQEISTLNARVAALEAELAALQGGG